MNGRPARGELWWCEIAEIRRRPVVVLSRDAAMALLVARLGRLADSRAQEICHALGVAVDCRS